MNLGPIVNSSPDQGNASISANGLTLYFASGRPGGQGDWDLWQVPIIPIVDFNGDGKVDGFEVLTTADRWGTDDSLCDIGPLPWGDALVGLQDLVVLADYIGKEVEDPTLIAHWALDETEGDIAHDHTGNDGTLAGAPLWSPDDGMVDGCLRFDGVDDYVATINPVLNPADGPFSVLAWVKGGAAGQVILSQAGGNDWLLTDSSGTLMTDLKGSGRKAKALCSATVITDDQWHRIGLTWDGIRRGLCVDGILVASDAPAPLPDVSGGFHIGAGANLDSGSYFCGLIDDIRVYARAVKP
ncbi:MAG: LamG-like jellyroll fold domain-containing protein [Planctomycetota bacterium]